MAQLSIQAKDAAGLTQTVNTNNPNGPATSANSLPVVLATDQAVLGVGGNTYPVKATFARPADTAAYAALDTVGASTSATTPLSFPLAARTAGGSGYITKARLVTDNPANVSAFRLHLYHTAPAGFADNAPFLNLYANADLAVGSIDFGAMTTEATGSTAAGSTNKTDRLPFKCDAGSQTLYGILETVTGFTPLSASNFYIELTIEAN